MSSCPSLPVSCIHSLLLLTSSLIPATIAWYAAKGRHDEGKKALLRLVGNVEGYDIHLEYQVLQREVQDSIQQMETQTKIPWAAMLKRPNIRRLIVSALPLVFQSFSSIALVFGFSTYFFALVRLQDPFLGTP